MLSKILFVSVFLLSAMTLSSCHLAGTAAQADTPVASNGAGNEGGPVVGQTGERHGQGFAQKSEEKDATTAREPGAASFGAEEIRQSVTGGLRWLLSKQNEDGGFGPTQHNPRLKGSSDLGITALCVYAIGRIPEEWRETAGPALTRALRFLLDRQQDDGSFYDPKDPSLQNYKTSVTGLALLTLGREKYQEQISRAVEFVKSHQFAGPRGYEKGRDLHWGGIGYGNRSNVQSDLSNTNYALEFLHEAAESGTSSTFERAQAFLTRAQNAPGDDPLRLAAGVRTTGDGGFAYGPDSTRGPVESLDDGTSRHSSYGSMSYAGLKSFLHAEVERDDPRVRMVYDWVRTHWTLQENPGMATPEDALAGQQGLFYYFHTMAKALDAYGERKLVDGRGRSHDWARELGARLVRLQRPVGFWLNEADRWMEGLPEVTTSFSLLALTICQEWIESRH